MDTYIFSFEEELPQGFSASEGSFLEISSKEHRDGQSSLQWDFRRLSSLRIAYPIPFCEVDPLGSDKAESCFAVWVNLPQALDGALEFRFFEGSTYCCSFRFLLNFTGWRACWVPFFRDMSGAPTEGMDRLEIVADCPAGRMYFDQMILATPLDPRHPSRNLQLPFVNIRADFMANAHWMSLYRFHGLEKSALEDFKHAEDGSRNEDFSPDIRRIENRYTDFCLEDCADTDGDVALLSTEFLQYRLVSGTETGSPGRTIDCVHQRAIYPAAEKERLIQLTDAIEIKECSRFLQRLAAGYHKETDTEKKNTLAKMFTALAAHLLQQGWACGSGQGTVHHYGYAMRTYYEAMYLMRDCLQEAGLLKPTKEAMAWFSGRGRMFRSVEEMRMESMDTLNTLAQGMLASILLEEDYAKKIFLLRAYSNWLSQALAVSSGLRGSFKPDGSCHHHGNHYPAYALGGMTGISPVVYFLSQGRFAVDEEAHASLRTCLLMMRVYSNKFHWPISMAARHPIGYGPHSGISSLVPFRYLALAGSPDGREKIDREMAQAYLRLAAEEAPEAERFRASGISAEPAPQGHWTMNYAAAALHRRGEWLACVRGHNRYLWANETYQMCNLYGRYITHGHLQILAKGDPVNHKDSGYVQEGWDFNAWPGTTTIHLPLAQLKSDVRNVDSYSGFEEMLLSDESFAGGCDWQGLGVFGMKLHEHAKYNGSHRARKSWFFLDQAVLCLGSDIENMNSAHETITTVFQNAVGDGSNKAVVGPGVGGSDSGVTWSNPALNGAEGDFRLITDFGFWTLDNVGNGYYLPAGQSLRFQSGLQFSRDQASDAETQGYFSKLWLEHRKAPHGAAYEYLVLPSCSESELRELVARVTTGEVYNVLQQSREAHVVRDLQADVISYCVFEQETELEFGVFRSASQPVLAMEHEENNRLSLAVCDPDLRLYEGLDADQFDSDGVQIERSLYSRPWLFNESIPHSLEVRLRGRWELVSSGSDGIPALDYVGEDTVLRVLSKEAAVYRWDLERL